MKMRIWPGRPYPLGATWDGSGTNFSIYSEHAKGVELCLFDAAESQKESHRIPITEQADMVCRVLRGQNVGIDECEARVLQGVIQKHYVHRHDTVGNG